jgi:hypothetical protein
MSLVAAASQHLGAVDIRRRLLFDEEYMALIIPLVSFPNAAITILNRVYSHEHAFHFSEVKSRSDAV